MRGIAALLLGAAMSATLVVSTPGTSEAASAASFDPAYIISDASFYDANAMTADQIQQFLESKVSACSGANCLRQLRIDTTARTADAYCDGYEAATQERVSTVIFKIQQSCGISARVILVTLQKEQSLVTALNPSARQLQIAMGYGCPDTSQCDTTYYGLQNQIYSAARQFKRYQASPSNYAYQAGRLNTIYYHPDVAGTTQNEKTLCGAASVLIQNSATAALYNYTPYVPNAAALSGVGDGCSSYGNLNFWKIYVEWFGSPTGYESPVGAWESSQVTISRTTLTGWTFDPITADPILVHLYINGGWGGQWLANTPRTDIAAAYPSYGPNHGFSVSFDTGQGDFQACLYAINVGSGTNTMLGCKMLSTPVGPPFGDLNSLSVTGPRSANVSGWAIDTDTPNSADVAISVNGVRQGVVSANGARPDVGAAFVGYGDNHGYSIAVSLVAGANTICVTAVNIGTGYDTVLGCRTVTTLSGSPFGDVNSASAGLSAARLTGWIIDPDTADATSVRVTVDGTTVGSYTANMSRGDVGALYPAYGAGHGFDVTVPIQPGKRSLCAYGVNVDAGSERLLGCRTVATPTGSPVGDINYAGLSSGTATLSGWALDPDTASPVAIHAYVNGKWGGAFVADVNRADIGAAFPEYGSAHGFSISIPVASGKNTVCLYGINQGAGSNPLLGCREFSTPTGPPIGDINSVVLRGNAASLSGWALDPDVTESIVIHTYVNGAWAGASTANGTRNDVGAAYPSYGPNHGFTVDVALSPGANSVCIYGINQGGGSNSLIGCRTVSTPSGPPFGDLNSVSVSGGVAQIQGWLIDPDVTTPVDIHVYVNGAWGGQFTASGSRSDVGAAYPAYGPNHGFSVGVAVPAGRSQVCVYGINQGIGNNVLLGCRTVG